jgi:hypothetical protein
MRFDSLFESIPISKGVLPIHRFDQDNQHAIGFLGDPVTPDPRRKIENFLHNRQMESPARSAEEQVVFTSIDTLENREAGRKSLQRRLGHVGDSVANQREGRIGQNSPNNI